MPDDGGSPRGRFGQSIAEWVVARPQNAVLALVATLAMPLLQVVAGALVVLLVLRRSMRDAVIYAALAGLLLVGAALVFQAPAAQVAGSIVFVVMPALLLGMVLAWTRSLTLTLQVTVILAAAATLWFAVVVADPVGYWQPLTQLFLDTFRQNDLHEQASALEANPERFADMMMLIFVLAGWMQAAVVAVLGCALAQSLGGDAVRYGRFRDLDFGRVIALTMAVASVIAWLAGLDWLQNVAVVMFAAFWLQGLAVIHWLHANGHLPVLAVVGTYVLLVVLNVLLLLALAVLGYIDAWFDYRRRVLPKAEN